MEVKTYIYIGDGMLLSNLKTFLNDQSYNINFTKNCVYIDNYLRLTHISDDLIVVLLEDKKINIKGRNITIGKMTKDELIFKGTFERMEIYEK